LPIADCHFWFPELQGLNKLVLVQFEAEAFRVQPLGCCFGQAS